jgi:hypothetical protein
MPCVFLCKVLAGEDVSKVGTAVSAFNFRSHPIWVRLAYDGAGNLFVKAWPATVGFKLVFGTVQFGAAAFADVGAFFPESEIFACEGHFGAFVYYDLFFLGVSFLKLV